MVAGPGQAHEERCVGRLELPVSQALPGFQHLHKHLLPGPGDQVGALSASPVGKGEGKTGGLCRAGGRWALREFAKDMGQDLEKGHGHCNFLTFLLRI